MERGPQPLADATNIICQRPSLVNKRHHFHRKSTPKFKYSRPEEKLLCDPNPEDRRGRHTIIPAVTRELLPHRAENSDLDFSAYMDRSEDSNLHPVCMALVQLIAAIILTVLSCKDYVLHFVRQPENEWMQEPAKFAACSLLSVGLFWLFYS